MKARVFRRRFWHFLLGPLSRSVNASLLDAGQLSTRGIHRILVLRPNHRLGNIILITPLLAELERLFPGAEIDVLAAGESAREILSGFASVQHVYTLPRHLLRHLPRVAGTVFSARQVAYDLAVNAATDSYTSRVLLSWVKARNAIGIPPQDSEAPANWARIMLNAPRHFATLPVFLVRNALAAHGDARDMPYPRLDLRLTRAERRLGRQTLRALLNTTPATPEVAVIGVFAHATGAKRFEEPWWRRFLNTLSNRHPECQIVEIVPADGRSHLDERFPAYYSSSLRKLASVIANLHCFVCADSGVMHLACASGTTTIGLFSVTDPLKYAPYGGNNQACDTVGKTPEEIAGFVADSIDTALGQRAAVTMISTSSSGAASAA